MSGLQYEPLVVARPVVVEHAGSITRIIVPMRGRYAPVPSWVAYMEVLALVITPIWWFATLFVRMLLRLPKPPRVVFEIDSDRFRMTLRDAATGETQTLDWPRAAVAEARANRYSSGLWLNVTGHVKETFLADVPRETIERLEAALSAAFAKHSALGP